MKIYIFVVAFSIICLHATGQSGPFIQPAFGFGQSNVVTKDVNGKIKYAGALASDYQVGIGTQVGSWRFATGLSYFRTGCTIPYTFYSNTASPDITVYFHHLAIPLSISNQIDISRRFRMIEAVGLDIAYNLGEREIVPGVGKFTVSDQDFSQEYKRVCAFAFASLRAEWSATKRLAVFIGPTGSLMLTNMIKSIPNSNQSETLHTKAYYVNAGVVWHLKDKTKGHEKKLHRAWQRQINKAANITQ